MSQTEGQPSSGFSMSVNSSVERRGLYWRWWNERDCWAGKPLTGQVKSWSSLQSAWCNQLFHTKTSDFLKSCTLCHRPFWKSAYAVIIKWGHILDKPRRLGCCSRGGWEWNWQRSRKENTWGALCLSEICTLFKRVESKVCHAAASTSVPFSFCHGCPTLFHSSELSLLQPTPVIPLALWHLSLCSFGRVEEASLVWGMSIVADVVLTAEPPSL